MTVADFLRIVSRLFERSGTWGAIFGSTQPQRGHGMLKLENRITRSFQRVLALNRTRPRIITAAVLGVWIAQSPMNAQLPCSTGNKLQDSGFEASTDDAGTITNPSWNSRSEERR